MKKPFKLLSTLLILTVLSFQSSFGQNPLSGSWVAHCVIEQTDRASIAFCDLCPYTISKDRSGMSIENFNLVFEKDYLTVIVDDVSTTIDCKYDEDLELFSFTYNEEDYEFKMLKVVGESLYIIKDDDGMLILLKRKKDYMNR